MEKDESLTHCYNYLAIAMFTQNDMHGAAEFFKKAIEVNPNDFNAYNGLSNAMLKLGNVGEAKII